MTDTNKNVTLVVQNYDYLSMSAAHHLCGQQRAVAATCMSSSSSSKILSKRWARPRCPARSRAKS